MCLIIVPLNSRHHLEHGFNLGSLSIVVAVMFMAVLMCSAVILSEMLGGTIKRDANERIVNDHPRAGDFKPLGTMETPAFYCPRPGCLLGPVPVFYAVIDPAM